MSVQELQKAVSELSPAEFWQFAEWFAEYQNELWDKQIAEDSAAGRLNDLMAEARRDFDAGRCTAL